MLEFPYLDDLLIGKIGIKYTFWFYRILAIIILVIIQARSKYIAPLKRQFFERDPSISYVFNDDTCDHVCLVGCGLGLSIPIIIITAILSAFPSINEKLKNYKYEDNTYIAGNVFQMIADHSFGLAYAILSTNIATNILKVTIARPRPSFFYLCNYKGYADAADSGNFTAYNDATSPNTFGDYNSCLNWNVDSISSFPSGHSSFSFACMTFTVLVLQKMFKVTNGFTIWGMLSYSPLIVSAWIAVTRVHDFKHHEDDVFVGAFIGIVCTLLAWKFTVSTTTSSVIAWERNLKESKKTGDVDSRNDDTSIMLKGTNMINISA